MFNSDHGGRFVDNLGHTVDKNGHNDGKLTESTRGGNVSNLHEAIQLVADSASHVRIDEGLKRGPRKGMREEASTQPHSSQGDFASRHTPEQRAAILEQVPEAIRTGETTTQIAARLNMPASTLRSWLIGDETVEAARGLMIAQELVSKIEQIETAEDALSLGRAREGWRAWSWIAERREARLYGQQQRVELTLRGEDWSDRLRRARERVIEPVDNSAEQAETLALTSKPLIP